jgi:hypothetical protein
MHKFLLLCLIAGTSVVSAEDDVYFIAGAKHLSSPTTGNPMDDRDELSYDMPYAGIKYHKKSWDMNFQFNMGHMINADDIDGDNPRVEFIIEKQWNINRFFD